MSYPGAEGSRSLVDLEHRSNIVQVARPILVWSMSPKNFLCSVPSSTAYWLKVSHRPTAAHDRVALAAVFDIVEEI